MSVPRRRTQCRRGNDWEQSRMEGEKSLTKGLQLQWQCNKAARRLGMPLHPCKGGRYLHMHISGIRYVYASGMSGASFALLQLQRQLQLQLVAAAYQLIRCECDFNCCPQSTPCDDDAFAKLESVWRQSRNLWTSSSS